MIEAIRSLTRNWSFDEQPCTEISSEDIDFRVTSEFFSEVSRKLTPAVRKTLGFVINAIVHADYATAACDPFVFRLHILVFKTEQTTTAICSVFKILHNQFDI